MLNISFPCEHTAWCWLFTPSLQSALHLLTVYFSATIFYGGE
jgi:hypothetical protein